MAKTAMITGAAEGIGYELARLFAEDGFNLILIDKNKLKLEQSAEELRNHHRFTIRVIVKDLSSISSAQEIFDELKENTSIDILVNNAGFGMSGPFAESDLNQGLKLLQVNLITLTILTRLFLPGMMLRKSGRILNVCAVLAFIPGPFFSLYSASKSYVLSFSQSLSEELRGTGISVTCLCPGSTKTQWHNRAQAQDTRLAKNLSKMEADTVAEEGYHALMKGKRLCIPGIQYKVLVFMIRFASRSFVLRTVRFFTQSRP